MTNEKVIRIYVRAMMKRIGHHAQEFYWMWEKCLRPELEAGHWIAQPRKGRTHRYGIQAEFIASNGHVLSCRYADRTLWLSDGVKTRGFSPRHGRAALRFVQKVRGAAEL